MSVPMVNFDEIPVQTKPDGRTRTVSIVGERVFQLRKS